MVFTIISTSHSLNANWWRHRQTRTRLALVRFDAWKRLLSDKQPEPLGQQQSLQLAIALPETECHLTWRHAFNCKEQCASIPTHLHQNGISGWPDFHFPRRRRKVSLVHETILHPLLTKHTARQKWVPYLLRNDLLGHELFPSEQLSIFAEALLVFKTSSLCALGIK